MASEADYAEEIQSPDGEEPDDDAEEEEEGAIDDDSEDGGQSDSQDEENDDPALNGNAAAATNTAERPPTANSDQDDSSSGGIRSPSSDPGDDLSNKDDSRSSGVSAHSDDLSETANVQSPSPVHSPSSDRSPNQSPTRSLTPVQSPSPPPPMQPRSPSCNGDDSSNDVPAVEPGTPPVPDPTDTAPDTPPAPQPPPPPPIEKGPLEDQEGELDFEEETPEERRDGAAEQAPVVVPEPVEEKPKRVAITGPSESGGEPRHHKLVAASGLTPVVAPKIKEEGEEDDDELEEGEEGHVGSEDGAIGSDCADEGEVEDDDDLEEGEVKDGTVIRKQPGRLMCRFYTRGQCTWGDNCRFLHPGINDKGNYSMFSSNKPLVTNNGPAFSWHASGHRAAYTPRPYVEPLPLPLPPPVEEPVVESAWERGLRHAKEILKKSSKRKESEPDFEDKRMNLGLSAGGDGSNEYEKENDYYVRSPYDEIVADPYHPYSYDEMALDPYERQAQDYWRGGNYENFEVRYTRSDFNYRDHDRLRERGREPRVERFHEQQRDRERGVVFRERDGGGRGRREKFERQRSPERNWREERYVEPQSAPSTRARGDEWRDPWRRSTSPKRRHPSRSFSSHSSASYSSSRSSGSRSSSYTSRSRSSSGSSASSYSSRSYSHSRSKTPVKHKNQANAPPMSSGIGMHMQKLRQSAQQHHHPQQQQQQQQQQQPQQQTSMDRRLQAPTNKPHGRPPPPPEKQRPVMSMAPVPPAATPAVERKKPDRGAPVIPPQRRRPSSSGSESATSRSRSRAAKLSAWPTARKVHKSASRSRSSRSSSLSSLESVSSKSSISSKSSFGSGKTPVQAVSKKVEKRPRDRERQRATAGAGVGGSGGGGESNWKGLSRQAGRDGKQDAAQADLRVKSLVNAPRQERTSKDPLKQSGQKPQIKLTLLNKSQDKAAGATAPSLFDAPELRTNKPKPPPLMPERDTQKAPSKGPIMAGKKRPLPSPVHEGPDTTTVGQKIAPTARAGKSPSESPPSSPPSGAGKKSTSSRREELLKQLKAVEDAIARKRSKLS